MGELILRICEHCRYKYTSNVSLPCRECSSRDKWELAETITVNSKDIEALQSQLNVKKDFLISATTRENTLIERITEKDKQIEALQQENEKLRQERDSQQRLAIKAMAQNEAMREVLYKSKDVLTLYKSRWMATADKQVNEAIAAIVEVVGE